MSEREYAVWVFNPYKDPEPRIIPVGRSRHWADKHAARHVADDVVVKVVYKYTFMPSMPWEDL